MCAFEHVPGCLSMCLGVTSYCLMMAWKGAIFTACARQIFVVRCCSCSVIAWLAAVVLNGRPSPGMACTLWWWLDVAVHTFSNCSQVLCYMLERQR